MHRCQSGLVAVLERNARLTGSRLGLMRPALLSSREAALYFPDPKDGARKSPLILRGSDFALAPWMTDQRGRENDAVA
jgi:hypothetical protein